MKHLMQNLCQSLRHIHEDEQGAEGAEKILLICAIVLPLLALLIVFRNKIGNWVTELFNDTRNDAENMDTGGFN